MALADRDAPGLITRALVPTELVPLVRSRLDPAAFRDARRRRLIGASTFNAFLASIVPSTRLDHLAVLLACCHVRLLCWRRAMVAHDTFGVALDCALLCADQAIKQVVRASGLSRTELHYIRRGRSVPRFPTAYRLACSFTAEVRGLELGLPRSPHATGAWYPEFRRLWAPRPATRRPGRR